MLEPVRLLACVAAEVGVAARHLRRVETPQVTQTRVRVGVVAAPSATSVQCNLDRLAGGATAPRLLLKVAQCGFWHARLQNRPVYAHEKER